MMQPTLKYWVTSNTCNILKKPWITLLTYSRLVIYLKKNCKKIVHENAPFSCN